MFGRVLSVLLALVLGGCVESMTYKPPVMPKNAPAAVGGADWTAPKGYGRLFITKTMLPLGRALVSIRDLSIATLDNDHYIVLILPAGTYPVTATWSVDVLDRPYTQFIRVNDGQDEFVTITTRNIMRPDLPSFAYVNFQEMSAKKMMFLPNDVADQLRALPGGN